MLITTFYRVPRGLLAYEVSMELQAYLANQDHRAHQDSLLR